MLRYYGTLNLETNARRILTTPDWLILHQKIVELLAAAIITGTPGASGIPVIDSSTPPEIGRPVPLLIEAKAEVIKPMEAKSIKEIKPLPVQKPVVESTTYIQRSSSGNSSGNTYAPGNCTWYAKSRRPDLPNSLGNADTWAYRAAAQGIPTGYTPQPGAVGQYGMHVVIVESVNGDGTFNLSEMNYQGYGIISSRSNVSASGWSFIY